MRGGLDVGNLADLALIRVEVLPDPAFAGYLGPADLLESFQDRAAELGTAIGAVAERLREALERRIARRDSSAWDLSTVALELAVNLQAESGVVIVKAKTGAAFKVSLTWSRNGTTTLSGSENAASEGDDSQRSSPEVLGDGSG
jgi:NTP-dependent ternary system trypsin peptidase co-occuring protein